MVSVFIFGLLYLTPGDPAALIAGDNATAEDVQRIRERLGLEDPIHLRFGAWLGQLLRGNLGESIRSRQPVASLMGRRLEPTISLAIMVQLFILIVGVPLGVLAAWKKDSWVDRAAMVVAVLGFSIPGFWLAFMVIWLFALKLSLFPPAGYVPLSEGFVPFIKRMVLPVVTTGIVAMAPVVRMTRACMVEVLGEDYIRTARAKGLVERAVLWRHALTNAAPPIVTLIGLGFGVLVTGLVITESVFAIPGLGRLLMDAIAFRDYPLIQGYIILVSAIYVFINLVVDMLYGYLDPRIRYQ